MIFEKMLMSDIWDEIVKPIVFSYDDFFNGLKEQDLLPVKKSIYCSALLSKEVYRLPWPSAYGHESIRDEFYKTLKILLEDLMLVIKKSISINSSVDNFYKFSFLDNRIKYYEIGKKLYKIGGEKLMYEASNFIPVTFIAELDEIWNGIGEWNYGDNN